MQEKRALITGAAGQLGRELQRSAQEHWQLSAFDSAALDITDAEAVNAAVAQVCPHVVINAAAYTAVDRAESEPERAHEVNATGPANLAAACRQHGVRLIHVSTDFVFDGAAGKPYQPDHLPAPLSVYGASKLAGERAVQDTLPEALIVRTAWVYSRFGGNFVHTMLRLMAERVALSVVADQVGCPTWARGLAEAIWCAADREHLSGMYHWSDAGVCSWYDFAVAIYEEARALGLLTRDVAIQPCTTADYPTPAHRPSYSVLAVASARRDFELTGCHWRAQLRSMLQDVKEHNS